MPFQRITGETEARTADHDVRPAAGRLHLGGQESWYAFAGIDDLPFARGFAQQAETLAGHAVTEGTAVGDHHICNAVAIDVAIILGLNIGNAVVVIRTAGPVTFFQHHAGGLVGQGDIGRQRCGAGGKGNKRRAYNCDGNGFHDRLLRMVNPENPLCTNLASLIRYNVQIELERLGKGACTAACLFAQQ